MNRFLSNSSFQAIALLTMLYTASAEEFLNWNQWRGPDSNALVESNDYPQQLSLDDNLRWKVQLPGEGSSTPVTWQENIYLTCVVAGKDTVCCLNAEGDTLWQKQLGSSRNAKHRTATGANPSLVTDGKQVYAYFKSGLLAAITMEGDIAWSVNLQSEFGKDTLWWDLGTSPVLTSQGILIAVMQTGESYLATFDKQTGDVVWKVDRNFSTPEESDQAYTTPIVTSINGKQVVLVFGADHFTGTDPKSGAELFAIEGFNPDARKMWRSIASPTILGNFAVVPYGRGNYVSGVNLSECSSKTESPILWTQEGIGSDTPTPVIRGNQAFILGDKGTITCLDLKTGEVNWSSKLPRSRTKCFSSPLLLGGLLYCFRENGTGHVVDTQAEGEILSSVDLDDSIVAQPIPYGDRMVMVRTRQNLYLFGN